MPSLELIWYLKCFDTREKSKTILILLPLWRMRVYMQLNPFSFLMTHFKQWNSWKKNLRFGGLATIDSLPVERFPVSLGDLFNRRALLLTTYWLERNDICLHFCSTEISSLRSPRISALNHGESLSLFFPSNRKSHLSDALYHFFFFPLVIWHNFFGNLFFVIATIYSGRISKNKLRKILSVKLSEERRI